MFSSLGSPGWDLPDGGLINNHKYVALSVTYLSFKTHSGFRWTSSETGFYVFPLWGGWFAVQPATCSCLYCFSLWCLLETTRCFGSFLLFPFTFDFLVSGNRQNYLTQQFKTKVHAGNLTSGKMIRIPIRLHSKCADLQ